MYLTKKRGIKLFLFLIMEIAIALQINPLHRRMGYTIYQDTDV